MRPSRFLLLRLPPHAVDIDVIVRLPRVFQSDPSQVASSPTSNKDYASRHLSRRDLAHTIFAKPVRLEGLTKAI